MSKPSTRRGSDGSASSSRSVSRASSSPPRPFEPGPIGDGGVARRQVEETALLPAAWHDHPDAAARAARQPGLEHLTVARLDGHVHFRRDVPHLVELLDRRAEHVRLVGRRVRRRPSRARRARSRGRRRIWNTWMTAPAGPACRPKASRSPSSAVAIFCWRSRERADRAERVAQVRGLLEPFGGRGRLHPRPAARRPVRSLRPSRKRRACSTARAYSSRRAQRVHARRDAPLDVVLQARPAALAGDLLVARADPEQPVRQGHRPAGEAGRQERPGVHVAVALDTARHEHARDTPRSSSAAGRGSSCRRAAGCCTSAAAA